MSSNTPRFMVQAARERSRTRGITYTAALAQIQAEQQHARHDHSSKAIDPTAMGKEPFALGGDGIVPVLALIAAARSGCKSCEDRHVAEVLADTRMLAALAAPVFGIIPQMANIPTLTEATRTFAAAAYGAYQSGDAAPALAVLEAFTAEQQDDLVEDALDMVAAGGADPGQIKFERIELEDEDEEGATYNLSLGAVNLVGNRGTIARPALGLIPAGGAAGVEHLREMGLPLMEPGGMPVEDPNWRLRANISGQRLVEIAHTDFEGFDDVTLWRAEDESRVSDQWWNLIDEAGRVLIIGPCAEDGTWSGTEPVAAVVATVSFWS